MKRLTMLIAVSVLLCGAIPGLAGAQQLPLILDYTGFTWTSGGHEPQHLWAVGVFDGFSRPVNSPTEAYTYYMSNLTLAGVDNPGAAQRTCHYSGGDFSIYRSTGAANRPYSYGTTPVNSSSPASFTDGVLWLKGTLAGIDLYLDDTLQLGSLTGDGAFTGGEFLNSIGPNTFFNFAGLTARAGNGIPAGYSHRMDGELDLDATQPVPEPASGLLLTLGLSAAGLTLRRRRTG